jgi:hypothetical protein
VPDAAGKVHKEYLFVEMDTGNGWMPLGRGRVI